MPAERIAAQRTKLNAIFAQMEVSENAIAGHHGCDEKCQIFNVTEENGRHERIRTADLYRVKVAL